MKATNVRLRAHATSGQEDRPQGDVRMQIVGATPDRYRRTGVEHREESENAVNRHARKQSPGHSGEGAQG
jgi:hypothetical protein